MAKADCICPPADEPAPRRTVGAGSRATQAHQLGKETADKPTENADDRGSSQAPPKPEPESEPWTPNPDLGSAESTLTGGTR